MIGHIGDTTLAFLIITAICLAVLLWLIVSGGKLSREDDQ